MPRAEAVALAEALAVAPAALLAPVPGGEDAIDLLPAVRAAGLLGGAGGSRAGWWAVVAALFLLNPGLLVWRDAAETDAMQAIVDQQANRPRDHRPRPPRRDACRASRCSARTGRAAGLARADRCRVAAGVWLQRFAWDGGAKIRLAGYRPAHADVSGALRGAGLAVTRYGDATVIARARELSDEQTALVFTDLRTILRRPITIAIDAATPDGGHAHHEAVVVISGEPARPCEIRTPGGDGALRAIPRACVNRTLPLCGLSVWPWVLDRRAAPVPATSARWPSRPAKRTPHGQDPRVPSRPPLLRDRCR